MVFIQTKKVNMNKSFKIITLIVLVIIGGKIYWWLNKEKDLMVSSKINQNIVDFEELNEKAYFTAKAWGIAGNHEEIILSTSPLIGDRKYLKDRDYIFYTSEVYYKKTG